MPEIKKKEEKNLDEISRAAFACCACETVILIDFPPVHRALQSDGFLGMKKIAQGVGWELCEIVYNEKTESGEPANGVGLLCPDCAKNSLHVQTMTPAEA